VSSKKRAVAVFLALGGALSACSESDGGSKDAAGGGQREAGVERDAAPARADAGGGVKDGALLGDDAGGEPGLDAGQDAGSQADVSACLDGAEGKDSSTEALEFLGTDGTQIALVRYVDPDAFGTSGTTVWLPERLGYARGASSACVTEAGKLDYTISHHNFDDLMDAEVDDLTITFQQTRVDYDMPWSFTAQAKRGASVVWGPVTLSVVSCENLTTNEDCSGKY